MKSGDSDLNKSFVIVPYEFNDKKYKAVFAKGINRDSDFEAKNLYLVYHSDVDLEYQIDGIYKRNDLMLYLERLLNRWRYTANEVLLVVPFIGFHYPNALKSLQELWLWLQANVDVDKTNLVTRKGTYNLFKKAQNTTEIPFEELVRWGLLEPLIEKMNDDDTKFFQQSHAKYYVGVFNDYVEVLSGSFNLHTGEYWENMTFKKYTKEFFRERYLRMQIFKDFQYLTDATDRKVHYYFCGNERQNTGFNLISHRDLFDRFLVNL